MCGIQIIKKKSSCERVIDRRKLKERLEQSIAEAKFAVFHKDPAIRSP